MIKKFFSSKLHCVIIMFLVGFFLGITVKAVPADDSSFKYLDFFHFVYQSVKTDYVENASPKVLFEGAIRGMLQSLDDPYTRFLDEAEYAEFKEEVTGKFIGIGVEISIKEGEIVVVSPIEDTPAKKAGIRAGDIIVKIDDTFTKGKQVSEIIKKIKGTPESKVSLLVRREGIPELLQFEVKREPIKVSSVKYGVMTENPSVGYLRITHFYAETAVDVEKALKDLNNKKMRKIILDLRDNPGGDMDSAIKIADMLLDQGKVIVSTRGREGSGINEEYKSQSMPSYTGDMLVLVNGGSASASEILSGALRDNKRSKLIGQKTFGKALVQRVIDVESEKTGFTLTIRKYYTPSGEMIHKKGILPDIQTPAYAVPENDKKNLGRAFNDKLFEEFSKTHPEYNAENRKLFADFLKGKNISLSDKVSSYFYKQELYRYKQNPLYDLEFDQELNKALELYK
ncbi:MAG: S41 family peptidase [Spirochaetota bacterium]